jgi:hypothetical protein
MMAAASEIETNPVHRVVWLLRNVIAQSIPAPPPDIPAIKTAKFILRKYSLD